MSNRNYGEMTLKELQKKLMVCWKKDPESFREIRKEQGAYVFAAVMAVILGGTGTSTLERRMYLKTIFQRIESTAWRANAGLRANQISGCNYQQRGFFRYPEINNAMLKERFPDSCTISEVCKIIQTCPNSYFRENRCNREHEPRENFLQTFLKIVAYACGET